MAWLAGWRRSVPGELGDGFPGAGIVDEVLPGGCGGDERGGGGVVQRAGPARRRSLPLRQREQCDNYVTAPEFIPQLQAQLADITDLRDDAAARGWHTEVARHSRVIAGLQAHLHRLKRDQGPDIKGATSQGRLIEIFFSVIQKKD